MLRAAIAFRDGGYGTPVLVGREDVYDGCSELGVEDPQDYRGPQQPQFAAGRARGRLSSTPSTSGTACCAARSSGWSTRTATSSRAAMLALGEADAMITGMTRPFSQSLRQVRAVIDAEPGATPFGVHVIVGRSHTVLHRRHGGDRAADRRAICRDRDALRRPSPGAWATSRASPSLCYSNFGNPPGRPYRGAARRR